MFRQFEFEKSIYPKLEKIPISTRFKLETIGIDFPLPVWSQLALEERWVLCHMPVRSKGERECYCGYLAYLLRRQRATASLALQKGTGPDRKAWEEISRLPSEVAEKARALNLPLFWPEWIKLDDMERYVVYKLCLENSDNQMILQVVQELLGRSASPISNP